MPYTPFILTLLLASFLTACAGSDKNSSVDNNASNPDATQEQEDVINKQQQSDLNVTKHQDYTEQWVIDIDLHSDTQVGETLSQSFKLRSDHPIEQTVVLSHFFFKQYL
ncbi:MAG: hypothetical protein HRU20_23980 [Pseudomonadales bacterium]|nr:hypothetical protein [Pseudomonadales bacterium]